jgi:hypothetical protein
LFARQGFGGHSPRKYRVVFDTEEISNPNGQACWMTFSVDGRLAVYLRSTATQTTISRLSCDLIWQTANQSFPGPF